MEERIRRTVPKPMGAGITVTMWLGPLFLLFGASRCTTAWVIGKTCDPFLFHWIGACLLSPPSIFATLMLLLFEPRVTGKRIFAPMIAACVLWSLPAWFLWVMRR